MKWSYLAWVVCVEVLGGGAGDQVEGVVVEDQAGVGCQQENGKGLFLSLQMTYVQGGAFGQAAM